MNNYFENKKKSVRSGSDGMTIIELMVVLVIASIISIAMFRVFETSSKMATRQNVSIDAQEGLRSALNFMAKDLSMAGLSTSAMGGVPGVIIADSTRMRFTADRNVNGTIDTFVFGDPSGNAPEILEYALNGNQLVVIPNPPTDTSVNADPAGQIVILENVNGLAFSYLDPNGNRLATPMTDPLNRTQLKRIRSVEITLTAQAADTATSTGAELTMLKLIRCRNLGIWE